MKRCSLENGKKRDGTAHSWIMSVIREGTLPSLLGCKGDDGKIVLSDLKDSVSVILQ